MSKDFRARAKLRPRGHLYEDFSVGQKFVHRWGRAITESDAIAFSTLTLGFNPLYFNAEYAMAHGHDSVVVNPLLIVNTAQGHFNELAMSVSPFKQRSATKRRHHWGKEADG